MKLNKIKLLSNRIFTECSDCGDLLIGSETNDTSNGIVCDDCFQDYMECANCRGYFPENDMTRTNQDDYCPDCLSELFSTCDSCGSVVAVEDAIWQDEETWCQSCYDRNFFTCTNCGEIYNNDQEVYHDGDSYCRECFSENFSLCDSCGSTVSADEISDGLCPDCQSSRTIHDCDYVPDTYFHPSARSWSRPVPGMLYFGLELEVDKMTDISGTAEILHEMDPEETDFYLKTDGSIYHGFEVVFHPRSVESWNAYFPELQKICRYLSGTGAKSHNTQSCGLHIHMTRNILSRSNELKYAAFINLSREYWEKVSRRANNSYAEYVGICTAHDFKACLKRRKYSSVAYHRSGATLETRTFRGSLNPETLISTININAKLSTWINQFSIPKILREGSRLFPRFATSFEKESRERKYIDYVLSRPVATGKDNN